MKRGTQVHPKMLQLACELDVPVVVAVGLLEMLWLWAARYAAQGDIGKWPDDVIERESGWRDLVSKFPDYDVGRDSVLTQSRLSRDPNTKNGASGRDSVATQSRLVAALVHSGWLDVADGCRLYIHDWHDHSDNAADKYLSERGLCYALGHPTRRKCKVATQSRPSRDPVATLSDQSQASHTHSHTHTHSQTHSLHEGGSEGDQVDEVPDGKSVAGQFAEKSTSKYTGLFIAIAKTGKFSEGLSEAHVAQALQAWPGADPCDPDFIDGCRLEATGLVSKVGAAIPWLEAMFGRVCNRLGIKNARGDEDGGGGDAGPRKRRFEALTEGVE